MVALEALTLAGTVNFSNFLGAWTSPVDGFRGLSASSS